jgi:hypothetical protein
MIAVHAKGIAADDPLSVLAVGERPEPNLPDGWVSVDVRAASLNHHDLWTLRGVGVRDEYVGTPLGTDAAGVTADGREVVVHAVLGSAGPGEDETLAADLHLLSENGVSGTHAATVAVPARNLIDKPAGMSFTDAACLPTAYLTAYRMLFTRARLAPGARSKARAEGSRRQPPCSVSPPGSTSTSPAAAPKSVHGPPRSGRWSPNQEHVYRLVWTRSSRRSEPPPGRTACAASPRVGSSWSPGPRRVEIPRPSSRASSGVACRFSARRWEPGLSSAS